MDSVFICARTIRKVCDFMTNSKECPADIYKCPECTDGYMIVKRGKEKDKFFSMVYEFRKTPSCKTFAQIDLTRTDTND
jgi:hypothetical protein